MAQRRVWLNEGGIKSHWSGGPPAFALPGLSGSLAPLARSLGVARCGSSANRPRPTLGPMEPPGAVLGAGRGVAASAGECRERREGHVAIADLHAHVKHFRGRLGLVLAELPAFG